MPTPGGTVPPTPALDLHRRWTFEELVDLPEEAVREGYRYEVVDGQLVVTTPPPFAHQLLSNQLRDQLQAAAPEPWLALVEPPLPLGKDGRIPDIGVVRRDAVMAPGPYGMRPDGFGLVVEVVSPGSRKNDRFTKPGEYAEAGIPLLWLVEQAPLRLRALVLVDGSYEQRALVIGAGAAPVPWGDLVVDLEAAARL